jgi:predicted nucleic acid-binding protein
LHKLGRLDILESLFKQVTITQIIAIEFGELLPNFIKIENPKDHNYQLILEILLDPGEASAIALSIEKNDCLLIIDDLKARKEANKLNIKYTGTIGLLLVAKEKGIIQSVSGVIEKIRKTDFRISEKYFEEIKKRAGE